LGVCEGKGKKLGMGYGLLRTGGLNKETFELSLI